MLAPWPRRKSGAGKLFVQRAHLARRGRQCPSAPTRPAAAQGRAGVGNFAPQLDVELLGAPVGVGVAAIVAREPPGQAEIPPVPGSVHRALEPRRVHEGFRKQNRVPALLPVGAQTAQHTNRGAGKPPCRQAQRTGNCSLSSADAATGQRPSTRPKVPVPALQRAGLPAGQRDPLARMT